MKKVFCTRCESVARPKRRAEGSSILELILWLLLIVPGVIYSLWRMNSYYDVCRRCGSREVVPMNSARAKRSTTYGAVRYKSS
jgi:hypothetical protein